MGTKGNHLKLSQYLEALQMRGQITFSKDQALKALSTTEDAFMRSSQRLIKKRHLIRPVTGFYVIVGIQHRTLGSPPPTWYIQELMVFLQRPYYLALLSAAEHYGATHQSVQELQVITDTPLKTIRAGKIRIRFMTNKLASKVPTQNIKTPQGDMKVSTPEATAFDLVRYYRRAGGFSHVATVFLEMHKQISRKKLPAVANIYNDLSLAQRVGYLLETYGNLRLVEDLYQWLKKRDYVFIALQTGAREEISRNKKWSIIINTDVEPDEV